VTHEQVIFVFQLFQGLHRTGSNTVRLFAPSANQGVGGQLGYRNNPVVIRMIKIAALDFTFRALPGSAEIQVNEKPDIRTFFRLQVQLAMMNLFCTGKPSAVFSHNRSSKSKSAK
jgi:hypothetical protein